MTSKKKLKRALRFYADEKTWEIKHSTSTEMCSSTYCYCRVSLATEDEGETAREALKNTQRYHCGICGGDHEQHIDE